MSSSTDLPLIAVIGRPNVGKSTLFNRLSGTRHALVASTPGVTRDRREETVQYHGYRFRLVDTGGMGFDAAEDFSREVDEQIAAAVRQARFVWLLLDAKDGLTPFDEELHRWVKRQGRPYVAVVNKVDHPGREVLAAEFYGLGEDEVFTISAEHAVGLDALLEVTDAVVPIREKLDVEEAETTEQPVRVAFVGRPNVGKSSLVNRVLGDARMIVSDIPGTTREAIELPFEWGGERFHLIDTVGIRRRGRTKEHVEKIGVVSTLNALRRADVAVLVVDAGEPLAEQDLRIAGYILRERCGVVVAMNKWDRVAGGRGKAAGVEADIRERLRFMDYAPRVRTSATTGQGLGALRKAVVEVRREYGRRIQTADVNRVLEAVTTRHPPPGKDGRATRVFYGSQTASRPPSFTFFASHPERIGSTYTRFIENQLRYHFGLQGTPVVIHWKARREAGKSRRPRRTG